MKTPEQYVDGIAKWSNSGMRAAVVEMVGQVIADAQPQAAPPDALRIAIENLRDELRQSGYTAYANVAKQIDAILDAQPAPADGAAKE